MAIRPMKDGVIADFEVTQEMLRYFITRAHNRKRLVRPRIIVGVPFGITEVEKRAVRDSAKHAGAREVFLVAEPIAAAIGVGLPVDQPSGNMIIDVEMGHIRTFINNNPGAFMPRKSRNTVFQIFHFLVF